MAQKFVSLEEAAKRLGVTTDRLNELRESGRARAFRDGAGWKFKEDEVERLSGAGAFAPADDDLDDDLDSLEPFALEGQGSDLELPALGAGDIEGQDRGAKSADFEEPDSLELELDETDAILASEIEIGEGERNSSSTIIGKDPSAESADFDSDEIDLKAAEDAPASEGSDLELPMGIDVNLEASDLELDLGESNVLSPNSGGSGVLDGEDVGSAARFEDLDELEIDLETEASQIGLVADTNVAPAAPPAPQPKGESSIPLESEDSRLDTTTGSAAPVGESSIELADDDDDEMVLGDGSGSDLTLSSGQSGISLIDESDMGISLDEAPPVIGGSKAESVETAEGSGIAVSEDFASGIGSALGIETGPEEDIVLTPVDGGSSLSAADSGSQVVSLDLEEADFDENTATLLGSESTLGAELGLGDGASSPSMLEEDVTESGVGLAAAPAELAVPGLAASAAVHDTQYSAANIVFLFLCALLLFFAGAMMFDLLRSIWSWNEPYSLNSTIMDTILQALP